MRLILWEFGVNLDECINLIYEKVFSWLLCELECEVFGKFIVIMSCVYGGVE